MLRCNPLLLNIIKNTFLQFLIESNTHAMGIKSLFINDLELDAVFYLP